VPLTHATQSMNRTIRHLGLLVASGLVGACHTTAEPRPDAPPEQAPAASPKPTPEPAAKTREPFTIEVPGSLARIDFVPIPPGELDGVEVPGFWMSTTEIPWEAYDVFVHRLDLPEADREADAETRPSKPYINMDRGFGHNGYPAISMSSHAAQRFCRWLSEHSGRTLRLPTDVEWEYACRAGASSPWSTGSDEAAVDAVAWHRGNSSWKTHAIATKEPNAFGLFDMHGNAAEWCLETSGESVVCGGSYKDPLERLRADQRIEPSPAWNASDPQVPKSVWWLADAGWIGFRVVCDGP